VRVTPETAEGELVGAVAGDGRAAVVSVGHTGQ